jgi:hypothetical protein
VNFAFQGAIWVHQGEAAWHFLTLPSAISDEIADLPVANRRGFGSVRVEATIGETTWQTSIFPDTKAKSYVLPVKKAVRAAEGLEDGARVDIALAVLEE